MVLFDSSRDQGREQKEVMEVFSSTLVQTELIIFQEVIEHRMEFFFTELIRVSHAVEKLVIALTVRLRTESRAFGDTSNPSLERERLPTFRCHSVPLPLFAIRRTRQDGQGAKGIHVRHAAAVQDVIYGCHNLP